MRIPIACDNKDCVQRWSETEFSDLFYHGGHEVSVARFCSAPCRDQELRRLGYLSRADRTPL